MTVNHLAARSKPRPLRFEASYFFTTFNSKTVIRTARGNAAVERPLRQVRIGGQKDGPEADPTPIPSLYHLSRWQLNPQQAFFWSG